MRVLMFGWEFPPYKSGGLGTACYGMGRALAKKGTEILFVLPQTPLDAPVRVGEREHDQNDPPHQTAANNVNAS